MKKEFTFNIFFLLLINLLIKPFYIFGIEGKVQQALGDEQFGLYFSLFGLVFLHQFINDPGIQNYNAIFLAQNRDKVPHHFPRLIGTKILLLGVMIISVLSSAFILGYSNSLIQLLLLIILVLFLSVLFVLLRSTLSSLGHYKYDTWFSGLDRLLLVIVLGIMLWNNKLSSIHEFVLIQMLVFGICVLIITIILHRLGLPLIPKFDLNYSKEFLKSCLPYTIIIFLTAIVMRADGVMIERMLVDGKIQAGIYAKGYRFLDAANMFGYLFGALLLPMYANKINEKKEIKELFHLGFNMLFFLSFYVCMVFYFYRQDIFALFCGIKSTINTQALLPLIFAILPVALTNAIGPLILAGGKVRAYNILFLSAVVFYLTTNFFFLPMHGIYASALIALITWSIIFFGMIAIVYKYKLINFDMSLLIDPFKISAIIFSMRWLIDYFQINWLLKSICIGFLSLVVILVFKIIPIKFLSKDVDLKDYDSNRK